ncbi:MAG: sugar phosphate nucleotidyltransferase [Planctomycetota bacterium]
MPSSRAPAPGAFAGAILAAGEGRRIQPFSGFVPKPLLPLLDRPLLVWQVERLAELGIRQVAIVIGHRGERIRATLGDGAALGARIEYVVQKELLGIAHAVGCLEGVVDRPFLLLLGDVFFESDRMGEMLALHGAEGARAVIAVREEADDAALRRNFAVETAAGGWVRRVEEKPVRPRTRCKGTGQYVLDESIFAAVRRTPRSPLRGEQELTDALQVLIDSGSRVRAADVIRSDLNLSTPGDLLRLNLEELARRGLANWVAPEAAVDPGASLHRSIVLAGARIAAGARLERSLVMPGEHVGPGEYRDLVLVEGQGIGGD